MGLTTSSPLTRAHVSHDCCLNMGTAKGKLRKPKPETDPDDKVRLALFIEEAKGVEVEAGAKAFERALNKLSRQGAKSRPIYTESKTTLHFVETSISVK